VWEEGGGVNQAQVSKQPQFKASRAHPRVDAGFVVRLIRGSEIIVALAENVSMVGLAIDAPLEEGDEIPLAISLPGERLSIHTMGRVERSGPSGSALTFVDLSWDGLFALARYLSPRL
jgi:hypothetical protein